METKDAIIIGTGQAAKPLSQKLAKAGWKILLVEKNEDMLGGTCLNIGCTPSKTLIASAQRKYEAETAKELGVLVSSVQVDFSRVQARKKEVIDHFKTALKARTEKAENIELVYGTASFTGNKTIQIKKTDGSSLEYIAPVIFIDTGARPNIPPIDGLDSSQYYDSTSILEVRDVPENLIIVGGGYIGLEIGQMFHRFGSKVTVIEKSAHIMSGEDEDVSNCILDILREEGMQFLLNASVQSVDEQEGKTIVHVKMKDGEKQISCTHLLLATGRRPNTEELDLQKTGVQVEKKGYINVDDKLETNVEGIYALGDCNGGPAFTHISYNDHWIVYNNLVTKKESSKKGRSVPYCMYTDPQLGRIGISETEAKDQGINYQVVKMDGESVSRGLETGKKEGIWKAIVDKDSGKILGAAIISAQGGEVASVIQMAMEGGIAARDMASRIFSHPSYAESINNLFMDLQ